MHMHRFSGHFLGEPQSAGCLLDSVNKSVSQICLNIRATVLKVNRTYK